MIQHTDGNLLFDSVDMVKLAERFGTPLFVFSQRRLEENISGFLEPFREAGIPLRIFYACKANSNLAVLRIIREKGLDIEVNSGGELFKAVRAGFHPGQIIFNGVAKTDDELEKAVELGVHCINVDSLSELRSIARISKKVARRVPIALRLIPGIRDGGHPGLETGVSQGKFGMHPCLIPEACKIISQAARHLKLAGIHAHIGSQLNTVDSFRELIPQFVMFKDAIEDLVPGKIEHFNIGGGVPVDYLPADIILRHDLRKDIEEFAGKFSTVDVAMALKGLTPQGIEIFMEPGRSIVGNTAILLAKVVRKKKNPGRTPPWLILDTGFNILLENFSYQWYFHMVAASKIKRPHTKGYLVGGPLCDAGDVFPIPRSEDAGFHRLLPESMEEGDIVAFMDTGAYTLEQMTPYNGRLPAMAVMITTSGDVEVIRKRYEYQDLVRYDLDL